MINIKYQYKWQYGEQKINNFRIEAGIEFLDRRLQFQSMKTIILLLIALFVFMVRSAASTSYPVSEQGIFVNHHRVSSVPIPFSNEKDFEDLRIKKCRRRNRFSKLRKKISEKNIGYGLFISENFCTFVAQLGITCSN